MFSDAYICVSFDIPVIFIVVNVGEHLFQKEKSLINPIEPLLILFMKFTALKNTESNKFTALHNIDKVKFIFIAFFHIKSMLRTEQIEMNVAKFLWEF